MSKKTEKFICDIMLGDLAIWLRYLGFKVFYKEKISDDEIKKKAAQENWIVLTKDKDLSKAKNIEAKYIKSKDLEQELIEVISFYKIKISKLNFFSKCPKCGFYLEKVDKIEVKWFVPLKIFESFDEFYACRRCGKVYWKGEKFNKLYKRFNSILSILKTQ